MYALLECLELLLFFSYGSHTPLWWNKSKKPDCVLVTSSLPFHFFNMIKKFCKVTKKCLSTFYLSVCLSVCSSVTEWVHLLILNTSTRNTTPCSMFYCVFCCLNHAAVTASKIPGWKSLAVTFWMLLNSPVLCTSLIHKMGLNFW